MATPLSGVNPNSWLTLNGHPLSFDSGDENLSAGLMEHWEIDIRRTQQAPVKLEIQVDDEEQPLENVRFGWWKWQPRFYAGLYTLRVNTPELPQELVTRVRIKPLRLTFEQYNYMLKDISQVAVDLLFQLNSPSEEKVIATTREQQSSTLREYELASQAVKEVGQVIDFIRRNPHWQLRETSEQRLLHEVTRFSGDTSAIPGAVQPLPNNWRGRTVGLACLPEVWAVKQADLTYDVYENRLLKYFLQRLLLPALRRIEERATREQERLRQELKIISWEVKTASYTRQVDHLEEVIENCRWMAKLCLSWSSELFLKTVQSLNPGSRPTQFLQKNPYYGRFYRAYLRFQQELRVSLNTERYVSTLALRPVWQMYEMWSVFRVTRAIIEKLLKAGFRITSHDLFYQFEDHFELDVKRNEATIQLSNDALNVRIKYEPRYPRLTGNTPGIGGIYSQLTPDMAIEVWRGHEPQAVLIFDAKYRYVKDRESGLNTFNSEDLDTMGKYRQNIRYKVYDPRNPRRSPQEIVKSAYIIYPGNDFLHYPDQPDIGAIPLVPEMSENQEEDLHYALEDILYTARLIEEVSNY